MSFQGMNAALTESKLKLDIRGAAMDSCPGPRPTATISNSSALLLIKWFCCIRDGCSLPQAANGVYM